MILNVKSRKEEEKEEEEVRQIILVGHGTTESQERWGIESYCCSPDDQSVIGG